ncbi:MAG TPA: RIP metalloprotease RseP [Saprospiraceae bacterium]|nr:RIP metalloprotease RseP [Saprospiraceae bacterium]
MDTLSIVLQFLLSLSILIVLHELGHFAPAKWFKTRVEKFYLFFDAPPFNSLISRKKGETEYGIGWLPLGGYVKISGMIDESMDKEQMKGPAQPWEFRAKKAWQRLIIMIGGVTVNFFLGMFLFAMVLWGWGREYIPTSELKQYGMSYDSVLLQSGFRQGDLLLTLGNKSFDRLEPNEFRKRVMLEGAREATVLRNGQQETLRVSEEAAQKIPTILKNDLINARVPFVVELVSDKGPAATAGIKKGDRIISFNGQPIEYFDEFFPVASKHKGQTVNIGILSEKGDSSILSVTLTEQGKIGAVAKMGAYFKKETQEYSLGEAFPAGVKMGWNFLTDQLQAFKMMFKGDISVKDNLGSVISIGKLFDPSWDWRIFWTVTASLSIILAFMNLLPIPALDGGYVLFLIWEVLTGRKVSDQFMERAVTVGFFLLIGLMIFALGLDVWRLF